MWGPATAPVSSPNLHSFSSISIFYQQSRRCMMKSGQWHQRWSCHKRMGKSVSVRSNHIGTMWCVFCLEVLESKAWPPWPPWLFQLPRTANKWQEDAPLFRCRHRLGRSDCPRLSVHKDETKRLPRTISESAKPVIYDALIFWLLPGDSLPKEFRQDWKEPGRREEPSSYNGSCGGEGRWPDYTGVQSTGAETTTRGT